MRKYEILHINDTVAYIMYSVMFCMRCVQIRLLIYLLT